MKQSFNKPRRRLAPYFALSSGQSLPKQVESLRVYPVCFVFSPLKVHFGIFPTVELCQHETRDSAVLNIPFVDIIERFIELADLPVGQVESSVWGSCRRCYET